MSSLESSAVVVFRLDVTKAIGSGHAMRCIAIAQAVEALGGKTRFAVSSQDSAEFLSHQGRSADILPGGTCSLGVSDADVLVKYCKQVDAAALFIDTYAVTDSLFVRLAEKKPSGLLMTYLDDLYTFQLGNLTKPHAFPVDLVLNYSFYANEDDYRSAYQGDTELLIGSGFAPLRQEYTRGLSGKALKNDVDRILVTTGSTNPDSILERMVLLAHRVFKKAEIDVVVGADAHYSGLRGVGVNVLSSQKTLYKLMKECDICLSAAGSTLYELSAMSVPTLAIVIAPNQLQNARAFEKMRLGHACSMHDPDEEIIDKLEDLALLEVRNDFVSNMHSIIDGNGSRKVAAKLLGV